MSTQDGAHIVFHKFLKTQSGSVQAILLYKRTQDAPIHPGYWSFFGGVIENSESPEQAVRREIKEELKAVDVDFGRLKIKKLCEVPGKNDKGDYLITYFSASLDISIDKLRLRWNLNEEKVEGEGLGWFTANEVNKLDIRSDDKKAVKEFLNQQLLSNLSLNWTGY